MGGEISKFSLCFLVLKRLLKEEKNDIKLRNILDGGIYKMTGAFELIFDSLHMKALGIYYFFFIELKTPFYLLTCNLAITASAYLASTI